MKKMYESPKAELVCYSTPDITSVTFKSSVDLNTPGAGAPSVVEFSNLHK